MAGLFSKSTYISSGPVTMLTSSVDIKNSPMTKSYIASGPMTSNQVNLLYKSWMPPFEFTVIPVIVYVLSQLSFIAISNACFIVVL